MVDWANGLRGAPGEQTPRLKLGRSVPRASPELETLPDTGGDGGKKSARATPGSAVRPRITPASNVKSAGQPPRPQHGGPLRMANLCINETSPRESSNLSPRASSVYSLSDAAEDDSGSFKARDNIQVLVRVRPPNKAELEADALQGRTESCVRVTGADSIVLCSSSRRDGDKKSREDETFKFDMVFGQDTTQQDIYEAAGAPAVDNCLAGFNSAIFAYGQTGAGKTHTMLGALPGPNQPSVQVDARGLAPRVFEYLFQEIVNNEENGKGNGLKYSCKVSFLEIYKESISDLLSPAASNLQIREDIDKGPFVDGLTETGVLNVEEVLALMRQGADRRHTGTTRLNSESSRSHSVFTCTVEKIDRSNGINKLMFSRLNIIDLAGSERVGSGALGGSQAQGEHLKEAANINKSLTTLGRVIKSLVELQKRNGKEGQHIPYRDSKLTFLLQQSLGGNAKTMIIANISPSAECTAETTSTLQFVQRAKDIRNTAKINWVMQGDPEALLKEIERLKAEIESLRQGVADPLVARNAELQDALSSARKQHEELELQVTGLQVEVKRSRNECKRSERMLKASQSSTGMLSSLADKLAEKTRLATAAEMKAREVIAKAAAIAEEIAAVQHQHLSTELQAAQTAILASAQAQVCLQKQVAELANTAATQLECLSRLQREKYEAEEATVGLTSLLTSAQQQLTTETEAKNTAQAQAVAAQEQVVQLQAQLQEQVQASCTQAEAVAAEHVEAREQFEGQLAQLQSQHTAATLEIERLTSELHASSIKATSLTADVDAGKIAASELQLLLEAQKRLSQRDAAQLEGLQASLESAHTDMGELQVALVQVRQQLQEEQDLAAASRQAADGAATAAAAAAADAACALEAARHQAARLSAELQDTQKQLAQSQAAHAATDLRFAEVSHQLQITDEARGEQARAYASTKACLAEMTVEVASVRASLASGQDRELHLTSCLEASQAALQEAAAAAQSAAAEAAAQEAASCAKLDAAVAAAGVAAAAAAAESATLHEQLEAAARETAKGVDIAATLQVQLEAREEVITGLQAQLEVLKQQHTVAIAASDAAIAQLQQQLASSREQAGTTAAELQQRLSDAQLHATAVVKDLQEQLAAAAALQEASQTEAEQRHSELAAKVQVGVAALETAREDAARAALEAAGAAAAAGTMIDEQASLILMLRTELSSSRASAADLQSETSMLQTDGAAAAVTIASLREEKVGLLECLDSRIAAVQQLSDEATALAARLIAAEARVEELDAQLLKEDRAHTDTRAALTSASNEVCSLMRAQQEAQLSTDLQLQQQRRSIADLQRDILKTEETLATEQYNLRAAMARLEERAADEASLRHTLIQKQQEVDSFRRDLLQRDNQVADLRQANNDAAAAAELRQRCDQEQITILRQELFTLRDRLSEADLVAHNHQSAAVRQQRAMQEIRRLIEWAVTPPGSARSSLAMTRSEVSALSPIADAGGRGAGGAANQRCRSVSIPPGGDDIMCTSDNNSPRAGSRNASCLLSPQSPGSAALAAGHTSVTTPTSRLRSKHHDSAARGLSPTSMNALRRSALALMAESGGDTFSSAVAGAALMAVEKFDRAVAVAEDGAGEVADADEASGDNFGGAAALLSAVQADRR